jgi:hypothetical protein
MTHTNFLRVERKICKPESDTSGIDSLDLCLDQEHFRSYHKDISYRYNSRGFRDDEWPEDLSNVIWCVGDSFTVGIGQPIEETWPCLLQEKIGKRCLNLGEVGCSNDTIAMRVKEICKLHSPKTIVVMWSYWSRRRINNKDVHHVKSDFGVGEDLRNFVKNYESCLNEKTIIIHSIIPKEDSFKKLPAYILKKQGIQDIISFPQLDYARDHHHFDIMTSQLVTDLMVEKINNIDNMSKYPI